MKAIFEYHKIPYQFQDNLRIDFSLIFMTCSASIFASICSSIVDGKCHQNDSKKHPRNPSKSILFATMSESRFLDAFWSPFGSLWVPFWLPLVPFGLPLAHFWLPLAPLAHFGSLLVHFDSLLAHFCDPLAHFGCLLASFFIFLCIFYESVVQNRFFMCFSSKIKFLINQIVLSRSAPNAPQQKGHPLF